MWVFLSDAMLSIVEPITLTGRRCCTGNVLAASANPRHEALETDG